MRVKPNINASHIPAAQPEASPFAARGISGAVGSDQGGHWQLTGILLVAYLHQKKVHPFLTATH